MDLNRLMIMPKGPQKVPAHNFEDMENKLYEMYVLFVRFSLNNMMTNIFKDIRGLLGEWTDELSGCERIWIRASVSNRKIFFDFDEAPFAKGDEIGRAHV